MPVLENKSTLAEELYEDIRSRLECPVCLKTIRSTPIKQCINGHIHCNDCHSKLEICPICREHLSNTRNLFAEQTLMKMPILCKFQDEGCHEICLFPKMEKHEKICKYRLVECISPICNERISFCKFLEHLEKKHGVIHVRLPRSKMDKKLFCRDFFEVSNSFDLTTTIAWRPFHFVLNNHDFFMVVSRTYLEIYGGKWSINIYMLGNQKEAEKYTFSLRIHNKEDTKWLAFSENVLSVDVPKTATISKNFHDDPGLGMVFTDTLAKKFMQKEGLPDSFLRFNYSLEISNPSPFVEGIANN